VAYRPISAAAYMAQAAATEEPWWLYAYTSMFAFIREQRWDRVTAKVQHLTGRDPRSCTRQRRPRTPDDQDECAAHWRRFGGAIKRAAAEVAAAQPTHASRRTASPFCWKARTVRAAEVALIRQPFLNVIAVSTGTLVGAVYGALRSWVPHAENVDLPNRTDGTQQSARMAGISRLVAAVFADVWRWSYGTCGQP
jgi:hypothetical protein